MPMFRDRKNKTQRNVTVQEKKLGVQDRHFVRVKKHQPTKHTPPPPKKKNTTPSHKTKTPKNQNNFS